MRKSFTATAVAAVVGCAATLGLAATASAQTGPAVVYDFSGSGVFDGTNRPTNVGDFGTFGTNLRALSGPNERYQINSAVVGRVQGGAGTAGGSFDVVFLMWDNVNTSAPADTSIFSGFIGSAVFNRTVAAGGSAAALTTNITFPAGTTLTDDSTFAYQMLFVTPGSFTRTGDVVNYTVSASGATAFFAPPNATTLQGSSPVGWFRDADGDKRLEFNEGASFAAPNDVVTPFITINASIITIPEPASLSVLSLGALGLLRRRRA